ncbi:gamma-interferon-responsive lysosomal thiol protein-like [Gastrolobium bilobum]|uniref:gamma-interferon-responsive lysosomal thiol protein-like n=1 Tax=Gastrolobium bilobum TaxID=150636 RepID=UPI002AB2BE35|nr:gamma-interferon-responsive lysosomal thiol protein-like [Gastrolobium bilobum]
MVSPKLGITIVIALVLFFFIYEAEGASYSSGSHIDGAEITPLANQKVNLSVYYESLCQSCETFIIKNLGDIFNNDLIDILNLQLVPWANAHINNTNNSISCQNGPDECELNSLAACALNIWPKVDKHYGLIVCFEFLAIDGRNKNWLDCLDQLGLPKEPILNCFNSGNGTELGKKYINETSQLQPPHSFVPWVVVNNQPIGKDYANFTYYVCKAYRGVAVPAGCNLK